MFNLHLLLHFFLFLPREVKILYLWSRGTLEQEAGSTLDVLLVHLSSDLRRQETFHTHIGAVGKFREADKLTSQVSWEGTPRGNPHSNRMSILHIPLAADLLCGKSKEEPVSWRANHVLQEGNKFNGYIKLLYFPWKHITTVVIHFVQKQFCSRPIHLISAIEWSSTKAPFKSKSDTMIVLRLPSCHLKVQCVRLCAI